MEEITAYKTFNGTIFENEEAAKKYEKERMTERDITNLINHKLDIPTEYIYNVTEFIKKHYLEIEEIYNKY